jgi:hypothetical protein
MRRGLTINQSKMKTLEKRTAIEINMNATALEIFLYELHKEICNDPAMESVREKICVLHELAETTKNDVRELLKQVVSVECAA